MSWRWNRAYREATAEERAEMEVEYGDHLRDLAKDRELEKRYEENESMTNDD